MRDNLAHCQRQSNTRSLSSHCRCPRRRIIPYVRCQSVQHRNRDRFFTVVCLVFSSCIPHYRQPIHSVACQRTPAGRRQDLKSSSSLRVLTLFPRLPPPPLWINDYSYRHLSANCFPVQISQPRYQYTLAPWQCSISLFHFSFLS
jgi:hypothetical protein